MAEAGPSSLGTATVKNARQAACSLYIEDRPANLLDERAESAIESVIVQIAKAQGFDGIEASAMDHIKHGMHDVLDSLMVQSHELSMVARRRTPSVKDGFASLQQQIGPRLRPNAVSRYAKQRTIHPQAIIQETIGSKRNSDWLAPCDEWLPSDEEEDGTLGEDVTKRVDVRRRRKVLVPNADEIPVHLPPFPPKHTWLSTPSFPVRSEDTVDPLTYLDIKVSSTRLTEASLRNLISLTDAAASSKRRNQAIGQNEGLTPSASSGSLFKTDVFSRSAGISPRSSLPGDSGTVSVPPTSLPSPATPDEDVKKGRRSKPISLRLRTASTAQSVSIATPTSGSKEISWADKRPDSAIGRQSISFSARTPGALRSTTPLASPAIASLRRGTTGGSLTAMPSQSYFTWGPPTPGVMSLETPLATPLTPGGFIYPPTPSNLYMPGGPFDTSDPQSRHDEDDVAAITASLPGIVNYKRSWYPRHDTIKKEQTG